MNRRLGKVINGLENYLLAHPSQHDMEQLTGIKDDYGLMAEYWRKGFEDAQRESIADGLLRRLYVLATNMATHDRIRNTSFCMSVYSRPRQKRKDWSMSALRAALEGFVTDVAMLDLEPEPVRQQKGETLYADHQQLMNDLFDYIWTSRLWKDSLADAFESLLLSPTIDSRDQQLIVSAITLSAMSAFGFNKFRVLVNVYRQTVDQDVRQRALVGWVLCADAGKARLYTEMRDMVQQLCEDAAVRQELTELQMQIVFCQGTEADRRKIQDEIMPELMKGQNLRITRQGIIEQDDDPMEDILHPDAAERNMEKVEQSVQRMVDMQKQGSDIYFGGFSQMKRFPFFADISNWFVPFYPEHPGISRTWTEQRGQRFLHTITRISAFCDSDKYSFVLAFNQVLNHLPPQVLKMVEEGDASPLPVGGEVPIEDQQQPAFIRRMYLQNLYRFFHLYPQRGEFVNPFSPDFGLMFANSLFSRLPSLQDSLFLVASFLSKRHRYADAISVLDGMDAERHDMAYHLLMGHLMMHQTPASGYAVSVAAEHYRQALLADEKNRRALMGYARACFASQDYQQALDAYQQLMALTADGDDRSLQLNAAVCLINLRQEPEALKLLYKLNYLAPNDEDVMRVLAWALTTSSKYEQAVKLYDRLLSCEKPRPADLLNYGYCLWFSGDVVSAVGMLRQFLTDNADPQFSMEQELLHAEHALLQEHGITDVEILLMLDFLGA